MNERQQCLKTIMKKLDKEQSGGKQPELYVKTKEQIHYEEFVKWFRLLTFEIPIRHDQKDAIAYLLYKDKLKTIEKLADFFQVESLSQEEFDKKEKGR